jgi:hypothetical protein
MVFFGSQSQSTIMALWSLLCPERQFELSPSANYQMEATLENYASEVEVTLVTLGPTMRIPAHTIVVDIERFLSASTTIINAVESSLFHDQEKDRTPDK